MSAQPAWLENPYGLVTLLDFMKQLDLATAFRFGTSLGHLTSAFNPVNIKFSGSPDEIIIPALRETFKRHYGDIVEFCKAFDLPVSIACGKEILGLLENENTSTGKWLHEPTGELGKRIRVELESKTFFYIPQENARFYQNPFDKWTEACSAFASAIFDIEEGSKCLALHRNTACVFHLMRVMGAGVTALGKSLNEPTLDASRNLTWDNVLSRCVKELGEKFAGKSSEWQSDKEFYAKATHTLLAVKDAWRNPNVHEVGSKYTDEETSEIYDAVRSFMRQIAKKLKESP